MKNGSHHKKSNKIFVPFWTSFFVPFWTFLEKNVICTFCLAKCIRTGQQNCSFWLHEEWLSPQKEQFFCSFLNVIFLEKNVICTFCLAKCIRKGKQILLTTWRMALSTNRAIFCSFLNVTFLENNVICTFCLAKCIRKGQQNCSFWLHDVQKERYLYFLPCKMHQKRTTKLFLLTTWRMALTTKRAIFLFLSERHLSRKERHLYLLPCKMHQKRTTKLFLLTTWRMALTTKMHQRRTTKFFLLTTWRMALTTKRAIFCSFLNVIFLEKNVICIFCLAKCIRKGQQIVPFDYMKNGYHHKKSNFLFLSERHLSRKERHL